VPIFCKLFRKLEKNYFSGLFFSKNLTNFSSGRGLLKVETLDVVRAVLNREFELLLCFHTLLDDVPCRGFASCRMESERMDF